MKEKEQEKKISNLPYNTKKQKYSENDLVNKKNLFSYVDFTRSPLKNAFLSTVIEPLKPILTNSIFFPYLNFKTIF